MSGGALLGARPALALAGLVALLAPLAARPAGAAGKVSIQLTQVLATEAHGAGPKQVDPSLSELQALLEKWDYRVFRNAGQERKDVPEGEEATFALYEKGFTLHATPSTPGEHVTLEISITGPQGKKVMADARVKIKDGGTGLVHKELESKTGRLLLFFTVKKS
jgi:hypothetical protein